MEILGQADEWTNEQLTLAFIRDFCPEERKGEVQSLFEQRNWEALDQIMIPYHNT